MFSLGLVAGDLLFVLDLCGLPLWFYGLFIYFLGWFGLVVFG